MESAHVDKDGRPIFDRAEDFTTERFRRAFDMFSAWVDTNLDYYKVRNH
jgi:transcription initiation factor TFIID subunit 5